MNSRLAMASLYSRRHVAVVEIQPRQNGAGPQTFVLVVAAHCRMLAGYRRQIRRGVGERLHSGFFIDGHGQDGGGGGLRTPFLILPLHFSIDHQHFLHLGFELRVATFQIITNFVWLQWWCDQMRCTVALAARRRDGWPAAAACPRTWSARACRLHSSAA